MIKNILNKNEFFLYKISEGQGSKLRETIEIRIEKIY